MSNLIPLYEQILAASAPLTQPAEIPELGNKVSVRSMSGTDRDRYFDWVRANESEGEPYFDAATAHALNARGELERVLFCWSRASTMGSQPSRRFLPLPPPRSMR
ncbi:hypothetical protein GSH05_06490 [Burkholderia pseudomallei]|uniref:hypothetical protein n=1 Tax=Burkholderia pseudomallei TaxID=28450 RepID=UPI0019402805|nr:hypothetical protein [Burkholderia pseudomallei]MBM5651317.1 hypothetical protein [Burkholderia pseudomallei]